MAITPTTETVNVAPVLVKLYGGAAGFPIVGTLILDPSTNLALPFVTRGDGTRALPVDTELVVDGATVNINNVFSLSSDGLVTGANYGRLHDLDTDGTTELNQGVSLRVEGAAGSIAVPADYGVITNGLRIASQIGNATGAADFNTGAEGAQTLRTVLATRHEASATPVSARDGDGTNFFDVTALAIAQLTNGATTNNIPLGASVIMGWDGALHRELAVDATGNLQLDIVGAAFDYGTETEALRTAAQIGNTTGEADFNAGAVSAQTLRTVLETQSRANLLELDTNLGDEVDVAWSGSGDGNVTEVLKAIYAAANAANVKTVPETVRNDYTGTNVTTGAWVELIASTSGEINLLDIFDSSGETLELGTGAAAAEARLIIINPGGNGQIPANIPAGTRVSIKAISANATVGELDINFLS